MIIVGRFLGFVRPLMPFIAGASRMPFRRFFPYDVLAAGAWSITFCTLGFLFWRSIDKLTTYVSRGLFAFGTLVVVIAGIVGADPPAPQPGGAREGARLDRRARRPARLERPGADLAPGLALRRCKPGGRGRRLRRPLQLQARVTPGNLGLELTTLLALAAGRRRSRSSCSATSCSTTGEPRIDRWAADLAERLQHGHAGQHRQGRDRHRLLPGHRRRSRRPRRSSRASAAARSRPSALVAGWLIVFALVHFTKTAYDRARPPEGLVDTFNHAFPSGHSAYAVTLDRLRHGAGARGRRLGHADRGRDGRGGPRRGRRRDPRLPARALSDRRPRRNRARGGDLVSRRRFRPVRRTRSSQWGRRDRRPEDLLIAGAAAAISLIAWLFLVVVPAWKSYWRVRDRLVATLLSVYVLARVRARGSGRRRGCTLVLQRPLVDPSNLFGVSSPARKEAALPDLGALSAMSDAVESGLGLPEVVRAAARALDASLVLIDRSSSVLAVAARSTADERSLMRDAEGVETHELRVGDAVVGRLRVRPRSGALRRRCCGSRRR